MSQHQLDDVTVEIVGGAVLPRTNQSLLLKQLRTSHGFTFKLMRTNRGFTFKLIEPQSRDHTNENEGKQSGIRRS